MKIIRPIIFLQMLLSVSAFGSPAAVPITCSLPTANLPPHIYGGGLELRKVNPGITVEKIRKIMTVAGVELTIKRLPYARMAVEVKQGAIDCLISTVQENISTRASEGLVIPRDAKGVVQDEYRFSSPRLVIYYNVNKKIDWDGKKLTPSVLLHSPIVEFNSFATAKGLKITTDNLDVDLHLKQLAAGRIDALMSMDTITDPIIKAGYQDKIKKVPTPLLEVNTYIGFSKKFYQAHPDICRKIWNATKLVNKDPQFLKRQKEYDSID